MQKPKKIKEGQLWLAPNKDKILLIVKEQSNLIIKNIIMNSGKIGRLQGDRLELWLQEGIYLGEISKINDILVENIEKLTEDK